ncbi:MAG: DUF1570 domain-containing protein [Thermoguttaceae bacterium]
MNAIGQRRATSAVRHGVLLLAAIVAFVLAVPRLAAGQPDDAMVQITCQRRVVEGMPIRWTGDDIRLLGRDGRLWDFDLRAAATLRKTSDRFRPYSLSEFRAALLRELGGGYEVTGTAHYLVAHPRGQRDRWAERFEELYRSFARYFSVRGLRLATPRFPMVAVVSRDRAEFDQRMAAYGALKCPALDEESLAATHSSGVDGYYRIDTNRINLYDMGGKPDSARWQANASVLIHEATHQTAFNTGVHSRYAIPPRWLAEGLAMLFEAPGVYDSHNHPQLADRVNREWLRVFRQSLAPRHRPESLAAMVASDDLFRVNPSAAYAEAWAMSFFFVENEPAKYARYLQRTATRPAFAAYSAAARKADFTAIFGSDWRMLESRLLRYLAGLP